MMEAGLRIGFSLLVVLLILWGLARVVRRPLGGGHGPIGVLGRQQLTRNAAVVVVRVAGRALVLGVTEAQVTLLTETEATVFADGDHAVRRQEVSLAGATPVAEPDAPPEPERQPVGAHGGRLQGSLLSPRTWTQTIEFLRERTTRPR